MKHKAVIFKVKPETLIPGATPGHWIMLFWTSPHHSSLISRPSFEEIVELFIAMEAEYEFNMRLTDLVRQSLADASRRRP